MTGGNWPSRCFARSADQPQREPVPRGPGRARGAGPRRAVDRPVEFAFAMMPHAGGWSEAGVLEATERYQHPLLAVRGTARDLVEASGPVAGLADRGSRRRPQRPPPPWRVGGAASRRRARDHDRRDRPRWFPGGAACRPARSRGRRHCRSRPGPSFDCPLARGRSRPSACADLAGSGARAPSRLGRSACRPVPVHVVVLLDPVRPSIAGRVPEESLAKGDGGAIRPEMRLANDQGDDGPHRAACQPTRRRTGMPRTSTQRSGPRKARRGGSSTPGQSSSSAGCGSARRARIGDRMRPSGR